MAERKQLDLAEDMRHQRREWQAERLGWSAMGLVLLLALLGLTGAGPLSWSTAGQKGSALWVEFQRFARYQAPTEIKVHLRPAASSTAARLSLNRDFFHAAETEVLPEPEKTESGNDNVVLTFPVSPGQSSATILFRVKPTRRWERDVRISLEDTQSVAFRIFIFP